MTNKETKGILFTAQELAVISLLIQADTAQPRTATGAYMPRSYNLAEQSKAITIYNMVTGASDGEMYKDTTLDFGTENKLFLIKLLDEAHLAIADAITVQSIKEKLS